MINTIHNENCLTTLSRMADKSINCCVTSPPYFGLRDYGHDDQVGLEPTPEEYVQKIVEIFREVRRVLKDDGTLWLNIGDSYAGSGRGPGKNINGKQHHLEGKHNCLTPEGLKPKDLIGIPWMVAFALRADGWYLRQDIIWAKPNPMPESVKDRCTKSHEYIFLLSKSKKYYYDADSIKTPSPESSLKRIDQNINKQAGSHGGQDRGGRPMKAVIGEGGANKRSVWTVTTKPYKEAHFATYPVDLIVPCIKAGCPEGGIVYDPFMGAGTTAVACTRLNRRWVGSELNQEYCDIAGQRIAPLVNQTRLFQEGEGN